MPDSRESVHHTKERLFGSPFDYGISISNLANEKNSGYPVPAAMPELFSYLEREGMGAELQLEHLDALSFPDMKPHKLPFLGIHMPILQTGFTDPAISDYTYASYARALAIGRDLQANYAVIHMTGQSESNWETLDLRPEMITSAFRRISTVAAIARSVRFAGALLLENLEFPLYPATREEILETDAHAVAIAEGSGIPVATALDVSHLWHSGLLIADNRWRGHGHIPQLSDPYAIGEVSFTDYIAPIPQQLAGRIMLIHITGSKNHDTHLLPYVQTHVDDERTELHLSAVLKAVSSGIRGHNLKHVPVINEAHAGTYEEMVGSMHAIRTFLA